MPKPTVFIYSFIPEILLRVKYKIKSLQFFTTLPMFNSSLFA